MGGLTHPAEGDMGSQKQGVTVYTDGGCRPNPGPGGWGVVILGVPKAPVELCGGEADTTNNRMEMRAALEALRWFDQPTTLVLVTDSQYLQRGVTQWLAGWRRRGWQTAGKTEVRNRDLWQALAGELERHRVSWRWTRGHAGNRWNERADRLAASAIPRDALPVDDPLAVHLFTAVAWSGKEGAGGWASILRYRDSERPLTGREPGSSPNRMHLVAAVAGLEALTRSMRVHLYTASDYLKDGATSWLPGWRARGWRTAEDRPVAHRELWERLDELQRRHRVTWHVTEKNTPLAELDEAKRRAREALAGRP